MVRNDMFVECLPYPLSSFLSQRYKNNDGPKIAHLRSENVNAQPPGRGPQELQGQNLYNLHRHPLGDAVCKISTLWCKQFQRRIKKKIHYIIQCKCPIPGAGLLCTPGA